MPESVCFLTFVLLVACAIGWVMIRRLRNDVESLRRQLTHRLDTLERARSEPTPTGELVIPSEEPAAQADGATAPRAPELPSALATEPAEPPEPTGARAAARAPAETQWEPPPPAPVTVEAVDTESLAPEPLRVEAKVPAAARAASSMTEAPPDEEPPPPVAPGDAAPPAGREAAATGALEAFLGGRLLLIIGVVALLFATGYFLKLAIDEGWIDEKGRIALGCAAGVVSLVVGFRLQTRGLSVFGQALMGLGLGAIYLCDFFASVRYGFYARPFAFAVVGILTAAGTVLAVRRRAPFLAWLGFAGAFFAPWLLGSDVDALEGLTTWLAVVDVGIAAALVFRAWPGLDTFGAVATMGYYLAWRERYFADARIGAAGACLGILVGVVLFMSYLPAALARRRLSAASHMAALLAALAGYLTAYDLFFPAERTEFALATCGAALFVAGLAWLQRTRVTESAAESEAMFAGALALVVSAVPVLFRGAGVAPAWSALGAAAVHGGVRLNRRWMLAAGLVAIGLAGGDALLHRLDLASGPAATVFDAAFFSALAPCAALLVVTFSLRRASEALRVAADLTLTACSWATVLIVAQDTWRTFARAGGPDAEIAALGAVGIFLAAAAAGLAVAARGRTGRGALPAWGPMLFAGVAALVLLTHPRAAHLAPFGNTLFVAGLAIVAAWTVGALFGPRPRSVPALGAWAYLLGTVSIEILHWGAQRAAAGVARELAYYDGRTALVVFWSLFGLLSAWGGVRWSRRSFTIAGTWTAVAGAVAALVARLEFAEVAGDHAFALAFWLAWAPAVALVLVAWTVRRGRADARGDVSFVAPEQGAAVYLAALLALEASVWALARDGKLGERFYLGGTFIASLWATAAFVYVLAGARYGRRWLFVGGVALAVAACACAVAARLFPWPRGPETVFAAPFYYALSPLVALVVASWLAHRARGADDTAAREETGPAAPSGITPADLPALAAIAYLLAIVSLEVFAWGAFCDLPQGLTRSDARLRAQMALSIYWAIYAAALVGAGFWRRMPLLRWAGIAIFLVTIAKAFLVDLSNLDTIYRVGSFLALGGLLVAASYLYQRRR